jgi:glycerol kinase
MSQILAVDQGTTSTKAYRLNAAGEFTRVGARAHRQIYPRPGWVEHDPREILEAVQALIDAAGPVDIVGVANQGETVVAWDAKTKRPLHNAIVWQDMRTLNQVEALRATGAEAVVRERAGLPLDPYFSASKLRWLMENSEGAQSLMSSGDLRLGTSDAFLLDCLTGVHATDVSTASRTSLMNLQTLEWDDTLCTLFDVPQECLPEIRASFSNFGGLRRLGGREAHIVASITDQQASLFGHGCRQQGDVKVTFGTGAFALGVTGESPVLNNRAGLVPTCAWRISEAPVKYALDGAIYTAGSAIDWLQRTGLFSSHDELGGFDGPSAAARGLMFVPAQSGLACPYWDRTARGMWIGIGLDTSRADLCRAVIEGVALRAAQLVSAFEDAVGAIRKLSLDGGLTRNCYFVQFLADVLRRPLTVSASPDLTAYGVARLCDPFGQKIEAQTREWIDVLPNEPFDPEVVNRFYIAAQRSQGWATPAQ